MLDTSSRLEGVVKGGARTLNRNHTPWHPWAARLVYNTAGLLAWTCESGRPG